MVLQQYRVIAHPAFPLYCRDGQSRKKQVKKKVAGAFFFLYLFVKTFLQPNAELVERAIIGIHTRLTGGACTAIEMSSVNFVATVSLIQKWRFNFGVDCISEVG